MCEKRKTSRFRAVLALVLMQLALLPAALGVTYASKSTRPEHILTYTTGRLLWDENTETDDRGVARLKLFRGNYDNVTSEDSSEVVAPGTAGESLVRLKNDSGQAIHYTALLFENKTDRRIPVLAQLTGDDLTDAERYALPDGVQANQVVRAVKGTVKSGQCLDLSVLWTWEFETGTVQDETDTWLGNIGKDIEELGLYVTVEDTGGTEILPIPNPKTGDSFSSMWYVLAAITVTAAAWMLLRRKRSHG